MIESNIKAGRQDLIPGKELIYGLSITDACVGWEDTHKLVEDLARCSSPASPQGGD
jgi:3-deoxy-7-phosphoheptulonate synthase